MEKQLEFDFMKDMVVDNDKGFDEIAMEASERFHQFMDHYKIPKDIREEIHSLCRWF
jgi:hypothetical protein